MTEGKMLSRWRWLGGDVDPYRYGGKWYLHEEGNDYAHVIEFRPLDFPDSPFKYCASLSVVVLDERDLKAAYECASYWGLPKNVDDLSFQQKLEVLYSYIGGDCILTLRGSNYRLIMDTLKDAAYAGPYVNVPKQLNAKWF